MIKQNIFSGFKQQNHSCKVTIQTIQISLFFSKCLHGDFGKNIGAMYLNEVLAKLEYLKIY